MKRVKNIGIFAHVDAGKTTITEQLLYISGATSAVGRVDSGNTVTDSMALERKRGITIRTGSTSLYWNDCKINLIDTPGHMDFVAEVERILGILEGAVLVISAKEGVQSQTRATFHHLQRLGIPTILFINKLDRTGVNLSDVYQDISEILTQNMVLLQNIFNNSKIVDIPYNADTVIEKTIDHDLIVQEQFLSSSIPINEIQNREALCRCVKSCCLYPILHGTALHGIGICELLNAIELLLPDFEGDSNTDLSGYVYKVERDETLCRQTYVKVLSGELNLRQVVTLSGKNEELLKIKTLQMLEKAKIKNTELVSCGDIAILPFTQQTHIGDRLGTVTNKLKLPLAQQKSVLQVTVSAVKPEQRSGLIQALTELTEEEPNLGVSIEGDDSIAVRVLGETQKEVIQEILLQRYSIETKLGELTTIYREQPISDSEATINIGVSPNPYYASIGLRITPMPINSGLVFDSEVSMGYLNPSFQNAVRDGVISACKHGLYGWEICDLKVTFFYGLYYSPVSTPSDFRHLTPYVMEKALRKVGVRLLEPYYLYTLAIPEATTGKAINDIQYMRGTVENINSRQSQSVITGKVPVQTCQNYAIEVAGYTSGQGLFMREFFGYDVYFGEIIAKAAISDKNSDKLRNMFLKQDDFQ